VRSLLGQVGKRGKIIFLHPSPLATSLSSLAHTPRPQTTVPVHRGAAPRPLPNTPSRLSRPFSVQCAPACWRTASRPLHSHRRFRGLFRFIFNLC
jgi:hypothetical protein